MGEDDCARVPFGEAAISDGFHRPSLSVCLRQRRSSSIAVDHRIVGRMTMMSEVECNLLPARGGELSGNSCTLCMTRSLEVCACKPPKCCKMQQGQEWRCVITDAPVIQSPSADQTLCFPMTPNSTYTNIVHYHLPSCG
jgi:hypothetical protein